MDKILIIEDEPAIRDILRELLTDAGYEVEEAADGLEGVEKFRAGSFSLVLLDLMLPKLDGYGVCEQIRAVSDVPVIMITALSGEEAEVRAFELRADDYITKPFSLRLVLMRVEAVLRRAGGKADEGGREILCRGSVEMDTAAHREPGRRGRASHEHGIPPAGAVPAQPRARVHARGAIEPRLGLRLHRRREHRKHTHHEPASQTRLQSDRNRKRGGIPPWLKR